MSSFFHFNKGMKILELCLGYNNTPHTTYYSICLQEFNEKYIIIHVHVFKFRDDTNS